MSVLLPNGMMIQEPSSVKFVKVVVDSRGQSELYVVVVKMGDDSEMPVDYCEDEPSALRLSEQCTDIINGTVEWEECLPAESSSFGKPENVRASQSTPPPQSTKASSSQASGQDSGISASSKSSAAALGQPVVLSDDEEDSWDDWGDEDTPAEPGQADGATDLDSSLAEAEPEAEAPPYVPMPVDEDSDEWPFDNGKDDWY